MKYFLSVIGLIVLITGFTKEVYSSESLTCRLTIADKQSCSPVLSLESGELKLDSTKQTFELSAHYDACFQAEDIKISGQYQQRTHKSIYNIELLAIRITGGEKEDSFPRTIGMMSLNIESKKGHFTDIWAMIRAHDGRSKGLEQVNVSCQ